MSCYRAGFSTDISTYYNKQSALSFVVLCAVLPLML